MDKLPLVSIIIPTYNNDAIVCEAIDCSLNQTYDNIEIIVVDDGSVDNTKKMLNDKYRNRINYIYQRNRGLSGARNMGIRQASGKYIQFLDADDLLDLDKINIQVNQLQDINGNALSYCDYVCCHINDIASRIKRLSPVLQQENPFDDIMQKWETELSIPPHCFLFAAALFKECGITFDESLPTHEDWECWMNIFALNPKVVFVDKVLAYYRVRSDSMSRDRTKMREGYISAIKKQIRIHRSNPSIVEKLGTRYKKIKYLYRDASSLSKIMEKCHPIFKSTYTKIVPWRIQRILD